MIYDINPGDKNGLTLSWKGQACLGIEKYELLKDKKEIITLEIWYKIWYEKWR